MARILIIDDDQLLRSLLRCLFESHHYEVMEAEDGDAGLRLIQQIGFDAVLCDIVMPNKEGLETIQDIRAMDQRMRIIAMSGGGIMDALPLARRLGADAILYKPFSPQELLATLASILSSVSPRAAV